MKCTFLFLTAISIFQLCGCGMFGAKPSAPVVQTSTPPAIPAGKSWRIIEEPPKLSNDRERLPFQTEQSVQPEGAQPVSPAKNRTIETPL